MRKNKKVSRRMSVMATYTMRFGAIVVLLFVMVIINLLASSSCTQLMKSIGEKRHELKSLEEACQRETTRWEGMCTPENIDAALLANGMSMGLPKYSQCIRMRRGGVPLPGQASVQRAKQRNGSSTAQYSRKKRR